MSLANPFIFSQLCWLLSRLVFHESRTIVAISADGPVCNDSTIQAQQRNKLPSYLAEQHNLGLCRALELLADFAPSCSLSPVYFCLHVCALSCCADRCLQYSTAVCPESNPFSTFPHFSNPSWNQLPRLHSCDRRSAGSYAAWDLAMPTLQSVVSLW